MSNPNNPEENLDNKDTETSLENLGGEAPATEEEQLLDGQKSKAELEAEAKAAEDAAQEKDPLEIPEIKAEPSEAKPNMSVTPQHPVFTEAEKNDKRFPLLILAKPFAVLRNEGPGWSELTEEMGKDETLQEFIAKFFSALGATQHQSEILERGFFENWLSEENGDIRQIISDDKEGIAIGLRRPKLGDGARRLSGKAARAQIGSLLGNGINNTIPLPHVGLNVEFTARSDVDFLNLELKMAEERTKLGHDTAGLIFQCSHFGVSERLFQFVTESITDINLLGWEDPAMDLAKITPITELPILYWGMASTMYPNGYPLDLPCATGPLTCKHIERVNLNVNRICWTNRSKLTLTQQKQLSAIKHKHSLQDVEAYAKEFANHQNHSFTVEVEGQKVTLNLGVPTIHEHLDAGRRWAMEAARAVEDILQTDDVDPVRRMAYMRRVIDMSALREYSPWVKKITFGNGAYVDDKDVTDIEYQLSQLSRADDSVVDQVFTEIQKYIEKVTVAIIALPNHSCTACGVDQATAVSSEHPELVPLDVEKLFFALKDRRLALQS